MKQKERQQLANEQLLPDILKYVQDQTANRQKVELERGKLGMKAEENALKAEREQNVMGMEEQRLAQDAARQKRELDMQDADRKFKEGRSNQEFGADLAIAIENIRSGDKANDREQRVKTEKEKEAGRNRRWAPGTGGKTETDKKADLIVKKLRSLEAEAKIYSAQQNSLKGKYATWSQPPPEVVAEYNNLAKKINDTTKMIGSARLALDMLGAKQPVIDQEDTDGDTLQDDDTDGSSAPEEQPDIMKDIDAYINGQRPAGK